MLDEVHRLAAALLAPGERRAARASGYARPAVGAASLPARGEVATSSLRQFPRTPDAMCDVCAGKDTPLVDPQRPTHLPRQSHHHRLRRDRRWRDRRWRGRRWREWLARSVWQHRAPPLRAGSPRRRAAFLPPGGSWRPHLAALPPALNRRVALAA